MEGIQWNNKFFPILVKLHTDIIIIIITGVPSPRVVWLQDDIIVDSSYTANISMSVNILDVPVSRKDLHMPFVCQASNNDLIRPPDSSYLRNVTGNIWV